MAPLGIPLDLYDAVRQAEKREKEQRRRTADMLVDAWLEAAQLRSLLGRVTMVAAKAPGYTFTDEGWATIQEAAEKAGLM